MLTKRYSMAIYDDKDKIKIKKAINTVLRLIVPPTDQLRCLTRAPHTTFARTKTTVLLELYASPLIAPILPLVFARNASVCDRSS